MPEDDPSDAEQEDFAETFVDENEHSLSDDETKAKLLAQLALDANEGVFDVDGRVILAGGRGVGLRFVATYFPEAKTELRIATSYFTLAGYDLGRLFIDRDTKIYMLVGQSQGRAAIQAVSKEMTAVVKQIVGDLGTTYFPLADAVAELIRRINADQFIFRSANEMLPDVPNERRRFHCKFYVAENSVVWMGSSNFTRNGLIKWGNDEQMVASRSSEQIAYLLRYYDERLATARDLLTELKNALQRWLEMYSPFDAYLKALYCCYGEEKWPIEYPANEPIYYQEGVIARAVEQAKSYRGALLLVATGLGKTVIGAEIARRVLAVDSRNSIKRVVVVAPRGTELGWQRELKGRGYSPQEFFDNSTLFCSSKGDEEQQAKKLDDQIQQSNSSTVFIIDEAHRYRNLILKNARTERRNQKLTEEQKESNRVSDRIDKIVERGAKIILLTATPYGTQTQNINSLLRMLPPTSAGVKPKAKTLFDGDEEKQTATSHWNISKVDSVVQKEVVTVLGLLHVLQMARDRGDVEETDGRLFLSMPDGSRKYLPAQIRFHRVCFPLFLQSQMEQGYDAKVFEGQAVAYDRWNEEKNTSELGATNSWQNNVLRAWLSSPQELMRVLRVCYDTPDETPNGQNENLQIPFDLIEQDVLDDTEKSTLRCRIKFVRKQIDRQKIVKPLISAIDSATISDNKLDLLVSIIASHRDKDQKIIVFVKRRATAVYLQSQLGKTFTRIGCTIDAIKDGQEYKLKSNTQRRKIIKNFAPKSNTKKGSNPPPVQDQLDILICTDADGIGQNMQDASVVVNYDLPLTADELFQRAGRILRPTEEREREVVIYTFVPDITEATSQAAYAIQAIVQSLFARQNQANDVIDSGQVLPAEDDTNPVVMALATAQDLENVPSRFVSLEDKMQQEASSEFRHIAVFEKNKDRAERFIDSPILSAKMVTSKKVRQPSVCVFIKGPRGVDHVLFNLIKNAIEPSTREEALNLLQCPPDTKKDAVRVKQVEMASIKAFEAWRALHNDMDASFPFERVCAVYLRPAKPLEPETALNQMLNE